ncbi:MAG: hypothetical protein EZS28_040099, partial [Streblomastix strix]
YPKGGGLHCIINSGEIEINEVTLNGCSGLKGGGIYASIDETGKLRIKDSCSFTSCSSTAGSGGAIYSILSDSITLGGIFIQNTTESTQSIFSLCSASQLGGAIYLDLATRTETKYDLTGASYSTNNIAQFGKNLFINAINLRSAVPIGSQTKLGAGSDSYEKANLINLIGYDLGINTLAIPLYFVYTAVDQNVYHVNNFKEPFQIGSGNDNRFCGHSEWPCLTIDYAISRSTQDVKKVGIISGYILNESVIISMNDKTIQIQQQSDVSWSSSNDNSIIFIQDECKFQLTTGILSFQKITFNINENATTGYIMSGSASSTFISISNCIMKMTSDTTGYSILTGFVELKGGILNINNIEIKDIIISDSPIILISENAKSIIIDNSQFDNITRTTIDDLTTKIGGTIQATIGGSSGQLSIQNTNFTLCISEQSYQSGALRSGIYCQISTGGTFTIDGQCSFICCKALSDLGRALYATISEENSQLILKDDIQFEGFMKDQNGNKQTQFGQGRGAYIELSDDGISQINKVTFNECKGISAGGIQINCQSSQKHTFTGTQFTSCIADQNGGGLYCIINSGEIEITEVTLNGCSGLNGGGIYSSIDETGKLRIKDS